MIRVREVILRGDGFAGKTPVARGLWIEGRPSCAGFHERVLSSRGVLHFLRRCASWKRWTVLPEGWGRILDGVGSLTKRSEGFVRKPGTVLVHA